MSFNNGDKSLDGRLRKAKIRKRELLRNLKKETIAKVAAAKLVVAPPAV